MPDAEAIVKARLAASPPRPAGLRLLYVRTLASSQRLTDAQAQVTALTQSEPTLAPPWLTLGAIELELKHPKEATVALRDLRAAGRRRRRRRRGAAPAVADDDGDDDARPDAPRRRLTQAWLLLAQAAEQQRDFAAAERWLAKIDNPQRALEVQSRRASLLARQGKMAEARELIRRVPERRPVADARAKLRRRGPAAARRQAVGRGRQGPGSGATRRSRTTPTCSTSRRWWPRR